MGIGGTSRMKGEDKKRLRHILPIGAKDTVKLAKRRQDPRPQHVPEVIG
jgi:hypothetical protein